MPSPQWAGQKHLVSCGHRSSVHCEQLVFQMECMSLLQEGGTVPGLWKPALGTVTVLTGFVGGLHAIAACCGDLTPWRLPGHEAQVTEKFILTCYRALSFCGPQFKVET